MKLLGLTKKKGDEKVPHLEIFLKNFNSEFSYIEVWFTYQNSEALEVEDKINIT